MSTVNVARRRRRRLRRRQPRRGPVGARRRRRRPLDAVAAVEAAADALDLDEPDDLRVLSRQRRLGAGDGRLGRRHLRRGRSPPGSAGSRPRTGCGWPGSSSSTPPPRSTSGTRTSTRTRARCSTSDDWTVARRPRRRSRPRCRAPRVEQPRLRFLGLPENRVDDGSSYRVLGIPTESPNDACTVHRRESGRRARLALRLARHQRRGRRRVHDHARQQRPRVPGPGGQRGTRLRRHRRRTGARLRLPGRPDRARPVLPRRGRRRTSSTGATRSTTSTTATASTRRPATSRRTTTAGVASAATTSAAKPQTAAARTTPTSRRRPSRRADGCGAADADVPLAGQPARRRRTRCSSTASTSFGAGWARFGPPATNAGVTGEIVLVNDGVATPPVGTVERRLRAVRAPAGGLDRARRPRQRAAAAANEPAADVLVPAAGAERARGRGGGGDHRQQRRRQRADRERADVDGDADHPDREHDAGQR